MYIKTTMVGCHRKMKNDGYMLAGVLCIKHTKLHGSIDGSWNPRHSPLKRSVGRLFSVRGNEHCRWAIGVRNEMKMTIMDWVWIPFLYHTPILLFHFPKDRISHQKVLPFLLYGTHFNTHAEDAVPAEERHWLTQN